MQGISQITSATMKGRKGRKFESMLGDLQTVHFDKGLDKNMEFEADKSGMETAYRTGYDPSAMIEVLRSLKQVKKDSQHKGSWFSTHPPLSERIRRCRVKLSQLSDWRGLARLPKRFKDSLR